MNYPIATQMLHNLIGKSDYKEYNIVDVKFGVQVARNILKGDPKKLIAALIKECDCHTYETATIATFQRFGISVEVYKTDGVYEVEYRLPKAMTHQESVIKIAQMIAASTDTFDFTAPESINVCTFSDDLFSSSVTFDFGEQTDEMMLEFLETYKVTETREQEDENGKYNLYTLDLGLLTIQIHPGRYGMQNVMKILH